MNKKYLSVILSLILVFSVVFAISGCNKDDNTDLPTESTNSVDETESTSEEPPADVSESTTEDKETEKESESTSKTDEDKTNASTNPTEVPTKNDEPATCDTCGGIIVDNSDTDLPLVGNYCDGRCDEWLGEIELEV